MSNTILRCLGIGVVILMLTTVTRVDASSSPSADAVDAESIVEAVMFATGPMVDRIDSIDSDIESVLTLSQYIEFRRTARAIIDSALASNQDTFQEAVVGLRSGNPAKVDQSITQLQGLLSSAVEQRLEAQGLSHHLNDIGGSAGGYGGCSVFLVCVAYIAVGLHNTVALTIFAAAVAGTLLAAASAVILGKIFWGYVGAAGMHEIERDRLVAQLTLELADI